jgi:hypothetical protein
MSNGIDPQQFRDLVIAPSLALVGLGGAAAEELMLGTALQESGCGRHLKQANGPALGIWQMEPATHRDIWANFLRGRPALADKIDELKIVGLTADAQLCANLPYACALARLVYERAAEPLPNAGDVAAQAAYYKRHYNTADGAASVNEYLANWGAAFPSGITGSTL